MEVEVHQRRNIRGAVGRALEWSAVMIGLVWLYLNARKTLGSSA